MHCSLSASLLILAILLPGARAQDHIDVIADHSGAATPVPIFVLKTKSDQRQFHLGERIEVEEDYSAPVPGRYVLLTAPETLEGGYSSTLSIVPNESVIDRSKVTGQVSALAILLSACLGGGWGGSVARSGPAQFALRPEPIRFPYTLNYHFQITRVDQASSLASDPEEIVRRTKIELELENAAETIRFLDTEEFLWQAVQLYDGSLTLGSYSNPFFNAILESSHRDLAVRLLPVRMLKEDFLVSDSFVDLLTAMTLQQEQPIAFQQDEKGSRRMLSPRAREILRSYVLALGESLPSKRKEAREVGTKTFENYASQRHCANEPLIPEALAQKILQQARTSREAN